MNYAVQKIILVKTALPVQVIQTISAITTVNVKARVQEKEMANAFVITDMLVTIVIFVPMDSSNHIKIQKKRYALHVTFHVMGNVQKKVPLAVKNVRMVGWKIKTEVVRMLMNALWENHPVHLHSFASTTKAVINVWIAINLALAVLEIAQMNVSTVLLDIGKRINCASMSMMKKDRTIFR